MQLILDVKNRSWTDYSLESMFISSIEHSWWGESNIHMVVILFKYTAAPERETYLHEMICLYV